MLGRDAALEDTKDFLLIVRQGEGRPLAVRPLQSPKATNTIYCCSIMLLLLVLLLLLLELLFLLLLLVFLGLLLLSHGGPPASPPLLRGRPLAAPLMAFLRPHLWVKEKKPGGFWLGPTGQMLPPFPGDTKFFAGLPEGEGATA